ncbi:MAG: NADPH-dependent oxidoreductase [Burkholderiaceae bacterium]
MLLSHRSVRAYANRPLAEGLLEALVVAAQSAANSSNIQITSVVAVDDPALKTRLAELSGHQPYIAQASVFLVWVADYRRAVGIAQEQGQALAHLDYLEVALNGFSNASIAAQNAAVAAESFGLGTVYIGGLRNHMDEVIALLGLPQHTFPTFGMCVGYPARTDDQAERVKPRLPVRHVLHRNRYDEAAFSAADAEAFDATIRQFYQAQDLEKPAWSRQVIERLRTVESLHGRHRLKEILAGQGFGLA